MYLYFFITNNKYMKKIKSELIVEVAKGIKNIDGFNKKEAKFKYGIKKTEIDIFADEISAKIGREKGRYINFEFDDLLYFDVKAKEFLTNKLKSAILEISKKQSKNISKVLIVGLGNEKYACDSLGKRVVDNVLITKPYLDNKLYSKEKLSEVFAISFGVYGTTGIESCDAIKLICKQINPDIVFVIDSLITAETKKLEKSIQISNTKLSPGGGVGNKRKEVSEQTLGYKVISLGVPLVANLNSICKNSQNLIVASNDVERKVISLSKIIAKAINLAFNNISKEELKQLIE